MVSMNEPWLQTDGPVRALLNAFSRRVLGVTSSLPQRSPRRRSWASARHVLRFSAQHLGALEQSDHEQAACSIADSHNKRRAWVDLLIEPCNFGRTSSEEITRAREWFSTTRSTAQFATR